MSIKKLFESTDRTTKNYLSEKNEKEAFSEVESARNVAAIKEKQNRHEPHIDYVTASNFAKYGSAELYYRTSVERILNYYPYDGSDAEINEFHNKSLAVDKYVFDNLYPRSHGHAVFSPNTTGSNNGWGTVATVFTGSSKNSGMFYGIATDLEYIHFYGGPGTGSGHLSSSIVGLGPNQYGQKFQYSNIYDENIYTTIGLPTDWGSGSRESNLKSDFNRGITVEFWLKTGSYDNFAEFTKTKTARQVIFDMWNGHASSSANYGRITLELTGGASNAAGREGIWHLSPFHLTVQSGNAGIGANSDVASGIFNNKIGTDNSSIAIDSASLGTWNHWAITMYNTSSYQGAERFTVEVFQNGRLKHTHHYSRTSVGPISELNTKSMQARLGALLTAPSGNAEYVGLGDASGSWAGGGKLSGSIDEFRFWKVRRTHKEIGENWFTHIRGGVNTDISNTTLGLYYKFNEGITHTASTDSVVLDYGGRVANGLWTGYKPFLSRNTGSAILEATASISEYKDPIIRENHLDVINLKNRLIASGSEHDSTNTSMFMNYMPGWILDEHGDDENNNLKYLSHILGAYFDKLHMQITEIPKFKGVSYTSASYKPIPFAKNLPQSLGLYVPEIFIDATIKEKLLNRTDSDHFESDLQDTKNLIYLNLYNNLANIYKSKGTQKSIRNLLRCFNLDERLMRLNTYLYNNTYTLKNNLKQTVEDKTLLNFNKREHLGAVVFNAYSGSAIPLESRGFISGSQGAPPYEDKYGFTVESDITFPSYLKASASFDRDYKEVSLFGVHTVITSSNLAQHESAGGNPTNETAGTVTQTPAYDPCNFQVTAVKAKNNPRNVYFRITGSSHPHYIPELTSSIFKNVYENDRWNISVRVKPSNYPYADTVSGSSNYTYDLIFRGVNTLLGNVQDSFELTASIAKTDGQALLRAGKRLYVGAKRTNITGALQLRSDVMFGGIRYWMKYIPDQTLDQHIYDINNSGISASYENISPLDPHTSSFAHNETFNYNAIALDWNFNSATASVNTTTAAQFWVDDISSGSALARQNYGWIGSASGWQHTGRGFGFEPNSTNIGLRNKVNTYKFIDPEMAVSSDMIQILSDDDKLYGLVYEVPSYFFSIEKSMYNTISEEMLEFFAGVVDFHNLIGEPVNRYRSRYKKLEKLREVFFRKVKTVSQVEKYVDYYKWFDDALSEVISQFLPASAEFVPDVLNTIESHVLERNKYKTQYPTLEFQEPEIENAMRGQEEHSYPYNMGHSPQPASPRSEKTRKYFWQRRALRSSTELTARNDISGDNALADIIDSQKETIRKTIWSKPFLSASKPFLFTAGGTVHHKSDYEQRNFGSLYTFTVDNPVGTGSYIKGGVNFNSNKNIQFTYDAVHPGGPVNLENNMYVPTNVLLGKVEDLVKLQDLEMLDANPTNKKIKRTIKVDQGRDWRDGTGYKNTKSSFAFPFNIFSSSVKTGFNQSVVDRVTASITVTNLHNDVYGPDLEKPMQGPFTDHFVGGHQSRHIELNTGSDDWYNRPEAWKILLGRCPEYPGAIGLAGADYPWPHEARLEPVNLPTNPYPHTASQKAVYYRDFIAKRPFNIKNILIATASQLADGTRTGLNLGNYSHNYEVIHTVGANATNRRQVDQKVTLPTVVQNINPGRPNYTDVVNNFINLHHASGNHFNYDLDYAPVQLTGSNNKSIIIARFAAPGGPEVMSRGFQDIRSSEFSVYNSINNRNLSVLKPSQGPSGSFTVPHGTGAAGSRVFDIHGKDFGLRAHLARHTGRFGRDSLFVTSAGNLPGASYNQLPGFHKVHRNHLKRMISGSITSSMYDNYFVQHPIPRSDKQYSWITASIYNPDLIRYSGRPTSIGPESVYYSTSAGYETFFDFVTASAIERGTVSGSLLQTIRLNTIINEPLSASSNTIGYTLGISGSNYINTFLSGAPGAYNPAAAIDDGANYLNLLLAKRGYKYGWGWKATRQSDHPIIVEENVSSSITVADVNDEFKRYRLAPVSMRGRSAYVNFSMGASDNLTLQATNDNEEIFFNENDLNNQLSINLDHITTPYNQTIDIINNESYQLKWIWYRQNLFPSLRNEFFSSSTGRQGYDASRWRDSRADRDTKGDSFNNSFNISVGQSSWILDAQKDFATRTEAPNLSANVNNLRTAGESGELQNNYFHYYKGASTAQTASNGLTPSALYSRKHMLTTPRSVVGPTGVKVAETGSKSQDASVGFKQEVDNYSGEANWDAPTQAGIIKHVIGAANAGTSRRPSPSSIYKAFASKPWYDTYDDYKYHLKLVAKDYAVVPAFRISDHVEDYLKYGLFDENKFDTFVKEGTSVSSSATTFYKDYSNSEFMKGFLNVTVDTGMVPKEIKIVCSASIRFRPETGFYPAERTLDLVNQFSKSFGSGITAQSGSGAGAGDGTIVYSIEDMMKAPTNGSSSGGLFRPLMQPLFAPGILYNTIKSGMAVDFPVVTEPLKLSFMRPGYNDGDVKAGRENNRFLSPTWTKAVNNVEGYAGEGSVFWDYRVPFEAIMKPQDYIDGVQFLDMEPHPSCSFNATASWSGQPDDTVYELMARNFFGEIPNFFLNNGELTSLKSGIVLNNLTFESGSIYGSRLKMKRSTTGTRTYQHCSGATGDRGGTYSLYGAIAYSGSAEWGASGSSTLTKLDGFFPIPQDPPKPIIHGTNNTAEGRLVPDKDSFKETFTMYSRPTAFGPPTAGRILTSPYVYSASLSGAVDSFEGYNWPFTPPYYHGECWVDFIFRPSGGVDYDLERIMAETTTIYRRVDPGPVIEWKTAHYGSSLILDSKTFRGICEGKNINFNAMQLSASLNLFGVENVYEQSINPDGSTVTSDIVSGKRWVVQSKFETPHLNFNDEGVHPITNAANNLTVPTYGAAAVPRGMWHQFGVIPEDEGITIEWEDLGMQWLRYHYDVIGPSGSVYNNYIDAPNDLDSSRTNVWKRMKSLSDVIGFNQENNSAKMGQLAETKTIREAVVAVPYIEKNLFEIKGTNLNELRGKESVLDNKKFIEIPQIRIDAALASPGTVLGESLEAAGASIRNLTQKMERYVLPPQFDFLNNTNIDPIVMYIFEFEYELDKDDLSYIWQNLAPRDFTKIELTHESVAHELIDFELLNQEDILNNDNLRWMVFKVKQKSQSDYYDMIVPQNSTVSTKQKIIDLSPEGTRGKNVSARKLAAAQEGADSTYNVAFNWPYDYLSFVELIKIDAEVLYKHEAGSSTISGAQVTGTTSSPLTIGIGDTTVSVPTILAANTNRKYNSNFINQLKKAKYTQANVDNRSMREIAQETTNENQNRVATRRNIDQSSAPSPTRRTSGRGRGNTGGSGRGGGGMGGY